MQKKRLEGWYRGEKRAMKFAIPRSWWEPTDHLSNCYFYMMVPSKCRAGKNASVIMYPDLPSPHCHTALSSLYLLCQRESSHLEKLLTWCQQMWNHTRWHQLS
ncbi:uncharacterized protein LOC143258679 isoform X3 [Tachypleus tridentatus]|uniref:uncharacterized protein LOC143258679 isoform X3 n=1 Tax=Tachypleus tridentatus TaxID=6853 RepID=UPI003FCF0750